MRSSYFIVVHLWYFRYYKINQKCAGSYTDCLDWTKNKKATINPINKKR